MLAALKFRSIYLMKMGEEVEIKLQISARQCNNNAAHRIWLAKRIYGLLHLAFVGLSTQGFYPMSSLHFRTWEL